jgi:hypothetical protein
MYCPRFAVAVLVSYANPADFAEGDGHSGRYHQGPSECPATKLPRLASTMRQCGLMTVAAAALLASGCVVAPCKQAEPSVTRDVVDYFHREWPLTGPPVIPADAQPCSCGCCGGGAPVASQGPQAGPECWNDDWNQGGCLPHASGRHADLPPAVPLDAPPPGRFFPAPVRPVFAPQGGT